MSPMSLMISQGCEGKKLFLRIDAKNYNKLQRTLIQNLLNLQNICNMYSYSYS